MSWSCSYTGSASIFHTPNQIGISLQGVASGVCPDLVSMACSNSLRTFFVAPGSEMAVREAVARAVEKKEIDNRDFRFVVRLGRDDHVVSEALLEKKLKEIALRIGVPKITLVLLPWPTAPNSTHNRRDKMSQIRQMRATWDLLSSILQKPDGCIKNIGFEELEVWQIESLISPAPPVKKPEVLPRGNHFSVSPWRSQMSLIQFCHSRGIECLVDLNWDPKKSRVGESIGLDEMKNIDKNVNYLQKLFDRELMQILTLWAINRGLVVFPDFPLPNDVPKDPTAYDKWRVEVSTQIKNLSLLLNPLFRKRPMWKHAFELTEKQMSLISELDESYYSKLNDKSMQRAPVKAIKSPQRRNADSDEEESDEENLAPWQKEYKREMKAEVERKAREMKMESNGNNDNQIIRNVDESKKNSVAFVAEEGDTVSFNPRVLVNKGLLEVPPGKDAEYLEGRSDDDEELDEPGNESIDEDDEALEEAENSALADFFPADIKMM